MKDVFEYITADEIMEDIMDADGPMFCFDAFDPTKIIYDYPIGDRHFLARADITPWAGDDGLDGIFWEFETEDSGEFYSMCYKLAEQINEWIAEYDYTD